MFQIDFTSHKSIYEQVIDNYKELIIANVLAEGTKLPSVRELSRQITVNPNTVQKAYKELEREGYIYTTSGIGTFVASKADIVPDKGKITDIKSELRKCYKSLVFMGLSDDEAKQIFLDVLKERSIEK